MTNPYEGKRIGNKYLNQTDGRYYITVQNDDGATKILVYARYVLECKLGRILESSEEVHHKDLDKTNDDSDNLELTNKGLDHVHLDNCARHGVNPIGTSLTDTLLQMFANSQPSQSRSRSSKVKNDGLMNDGTDILCTCVQCGNRFYISYNRWLSRQSDLRSGRIKSGPYCSYKCSNQRKRK